MSRISRSQTAGLLGEDRRVEYIRENADQRNGARQQHSERFAVGEKEWIKEGHHGQPRRADQKPDLVPDPDSVAECQCRGLHRQGPPLRSFSPKPHERRRCLPAWGFYPRRTPRRCRPLAANLVNRAGANNRPLAAEAFPASRSQEGRGLCHRFVESQRQPMVHRLDFIKRAPQDDSPTINQRDVIGNALDLIQQM